MPGKAVKDFSLPSTGGGSFKLSEQRGKALVICLYPKEGSRPRKGGIELC